MRRVPAVAAFLVLSASAPLAAQADRLPITSVADIAIAQGRLDDAERELFAASSASTHEPSARGALGMFMAARGRLKVGAVLLEEARQFGGDAAVIDARLARIYFWLGDWTAIAALKHYSASGPEFDRARWLSMHAPAHTGPDSVTVALEPNEAAGFGRIAVSIGRATMQVDINPNVEGLVLPSSPEVTAESQQFGMRDSMTVAVMLHVSIGALHFVNVPARLSPGARPAIGLDVLAAMAPVFDAGAHQFTLRQNPVPVAGDQIPFLLSFPGVRIVPRAGQPPVPLESAAGRAALRGGTRWIFDLRRGAIVSPR